MMRYAELIKLPISLESSKYEIIINTQLAIGNFIAPHLDDFQQVMIVTDSNVAGFHLPRLLESLKSTDKNLKVSVCIVPMTEHNKNLDTIKLIYDALIDNNFSRDCVIIGFGGGIVGDMAGYAAATYMRGVKFIQIPTTLLSMVDSSVGGKVGVNFNGFKNMIGAFKQPEVVLMSIDFLKTLSHREFSSGMAEVIKMGAIDNVDFIYWLEDNCIDIINRDEPIIEEMIARAINPKIRIVSKDEKETKGVRELLNFGHTFGHAIERHYKDSTLHTLHGDAVAIGMMMAMNMSKKVTDFKDTDYVRIMRLLHRFDLQTMCDKIQYIDFLRYMEQDKKSSNRGINLILLSEIGKAVTVNKFCQSDLYDVITNFFED